MPIGESKAMLERYDYSNLNSSMAGGSIGHPIFHSIFIFTALLILFIWPQFMQSKLSFFSLKMFYTKTSCFATVDAIRENEKFKGLSILQIFQIASQKLFRNKKNCNESTKRFEKTFHLLGDFIIFGDTMFTAHADISFHNILGIYWVDPCTRFLLKNFCTFFANVKT